MKFGYQGGYLVENDKNFTNNTNLAYRFNNGVPNQITETITPFDVKQRVRYDSIYAQEQWTMGRVTLQGAVRYDRAYSWFPEVTVGPTIFLPTRSPIQRRRVCTATTTSPRASAWRGTCSAPARRRSRSTTASTCRRRRTA